MAFELPDLPPMVLPGANEYSTRMLARAEQATADIPHVLDVAYGPDPFQKLDIWLPRGKEKKGLPVVLLIHGGAFRSGHKEWMGAHAPTITGLPAVLVSINYRLNPGVRVPECVADCFAALHWVHQNIASYGGDGRRIHLGGHSAGGYLAAIMALDSSRRANIGAESAIIRSCSPVSGMFTLIRSEIPPESFLHRVHPQWFAAEQDALPENGYAHIDSVTMPFLLAWGERDLDELQSDNARMAQALKAKGRLAATHVFAGADHFQAHEATLDPQGRWFWEFERLVVADDK